MSERTTQSRSRREQVDLTSDRNVVLEPSRRFFTAQGNDRANREARALAQAFASGSELATNLTLQRDQREFDEAVAGAAAGEQRDEANKAFGYNQAWDMLDAENDLRETQDDIREQLRGADWENMPVEQVQEFIDAYMQDNYGGLDGAGTYAETIAPGLLQLEAEIMDERREIEIQRIRQDQRVKINENFEGRVGEAMERIEARTTPEMSAEERQDVWNEEMASEYAYIFEQTNIFFDNEEKRLVLWESIYDRAIELGMPELIENVPERFPNGDPTGITDPLMADEHRSAINEATRVRAQRAQAEQDAADAANDAMIGSLQWEIYDRHVRGEPIGNQMAMLRGMAEQGIAEFSDFSAVKSFTDGQLAENQEQSPNYQYASALWSDIYNGLAGYSTIYEARQNGMLGYGKVADDLMARMMSTVERITPNRDALQNPEVSVWRTQIGRDFDPALNGPAEPLDQSRLQVRNLAMADYNERVIGGQDPTEAYREIRNKYDSLLESIDTQVDIEGRTGSEFIAEFVFTPERIGRIVNGEESFRDATSGIPDRVWINALIEAHATGLVSDEDLERMGVIL